MTPPAATAAGRALPRTPSGRVPRRVSGPARGRTSAPPRGTRTVAEPLAVRALRRGRGLADSRFLDRLVRGRLWIPLVATALMGIVAMQVSMLKMNAGISRAVDSAQALERQNAIFRADVSALEAGSRVDAVAKRLGMVQPGENSAIHFLVAGQTGAAETAARRMTAPSSQAQTTTTQAAATPQAAAPAVEPTTTTAPQQQQTATTAAVTQQAAPTATTTPQPQQSTAPATATTAPPPTATATGTTAATGAVAAPTAGQG